MSVLLEAFNPSLTFTAPSSAGGRNVSDDVQSPPAVSDPRLDGNYYSSMPHLIPSLPLTGLSPQTAHNSKHALPSTDGVENRISNEQHNTSPLSEKIASSTEDETVRMEVMHVACKGLLTLVKCLASSHIKVFYHLPLSLVVSLLSCL